MTTRYIAAMVASFFGAGALGPASAIAEDAPKFARISAGLANAIHTGADVPFADGKGGLSAAEIAELRLLEGCAGEFQPGGGEVFVAIDWVCGSRAASPNLQRSTLFTFNRHGELIALSVNPSIANFGPTSYALAQDTLPGKGALATAFAKAVEKGEDPSLGGIVPLTELQRTQLAALKGAKVDISLATFGRQFLAVTREGRKKHRKLISMHFDDAGFPTGLTVNRAFRRGVDRAFHNPTNVGYSPPIGSRSFPCNNC